LAIDLLQHILCKATAQEKLLPIGGRAPAIPTSLYADDATIFVAPIKDDINFLATTLSNFGIVTGLVTNCAKSHVATIRCEGIDINDILQVLPASHVSFPMRYPGFLLSVDRQRIIHFQYLEDKVTDKLVLPIGKHATMNGHSVLVKFLLINKHFHLLHHRAQHSKEFLMKIGSIQCAFFMGDY
jgi:hypothetical protein